MRIWLKPEVMSQYHLMPADISAALAEQNIEAAPGSFGEQGDQSFQYIMRYKGRLVTPEEFGDIVIRALPTGEILYLKDVADIELGRVTYGFHNKSNGDLSTMAIVFQTAGSNATQIINDCLALVDKMKAELPSGLEMTVPMNNNEFLYASIENVIHTPYRGLYSGIPCSLSVPARLPLHSHPGHRHSGGTCGYLLRT